MADDAAAAPAAAADRKKSLKPPGKKDGAQSESVGVFARFKPLKGDAERADVTVAKRFNQQKSVQVRNLEFSLDWVFDEHAPQEDVFDRVAKAPTWPALPSPTLAHPRLTSARVLSHLDRSAWRAYSRAITCACSPTGRPDQARPIQCSALNRHAGLVRA